MADIRPVEARAHSGHPTHQVTLSPSPPVVQTAPLGCASALVASHPAVTGYQLWAAWKDDALFLLGQRALCIKSIYLLLLTRTLAPSLWGWLEARQSGSLLKTREAGTMPAQLSCRWAHSGTGVGTGKDSYLRQGLASNNQEKAADPSGRLKRT